MHVAVVHDNFQGPTGMGLVCERLAQIVLDEGWRLTVVGTDVPERLRDQAELRLVTRYDRLPALPQHIAWCTGAALALRHVNADVVHVHSPLLLPIADVLTAHFIAGPAHARGVRETTTGVEGALRRAQEAVTRRIDAAAYRWGRGRRHITFVSEFLRDEFRAHYGEPLGGEILPPPAPSWRPVTPEQRAAARRRWSCNGGIVAGYMGGNDPRKGLAAAQALAAEPDLAPLIAGPGTEKTQTGGRRGLGFVEPDAFIEACDVFLGPASFDSAPVAVLQALSRGIPVAVSETSGWARAVEHHGAGAVWRAGTPFADAVRRAARADATACRAVAAEFSAEALRERVVALYADVAARPRR